MGNLLKQRVGTLMTRAKQRSTTNEQLAIDKDSFRYHSAYAQIFSDFGDYCCGVARPDILLVI